jgi:hypothetical protein
MPDQLYLLGNLVIMAAYAAIMVAIVVPVVRAGQLLTNKAPMCAIRGQQQVRVGADLPESGPTGIFRA